MQVNWRKLINPLHGTPARLSEHNAAQSAMLRFYGLAIISIIIGVVMWWHK